MRVHKNKFGRHNLVSSKHNDVLFVARRIIEEIWRMREGRGVFLALDWAKAFDTISPEAMSRALIRFGLPPKLVTIIGEIYKRRSFVVHDSGCCSEKKTQHYGICQGCPLSPFLFTIVMTVLLSDAKQHIGCLKCLIVFG